MSDTWRPFSLRRTIGGDVLRATTGWQSALRFGPEDFPFDVVLGTTLTGIPVGYDSTLITVQVPTTVPNRGEMVLVRGAFGPPTTSLDGVPVWYQPDNQGNPVTDQTNQLVVDRPLTGGHWYYYSLFVRVVDQAFPVQGEWLQAATCAVLVPRDYSHAEKLFSLIPEFYQRSDDQQSGDGRNGPLRRFMAVVGYDADYNRTLLDGVINVYDPDLAPLKFVQLLGTNMGLPVEHALGGARYRTLVGQLWDLEGIRGTIPGLQAFVYAASNYECVVTTGGNQLLTPDDSEFVSGVGHWQSFTNAQVTTIKNAFSNIHPPGGPQTNLVVRPYTGSATPPLPLQVSAGRGIMEVLDTQGLLTDYVVVAGLTPTGITNGAPDALQIGIPVRGGELWEFSFWMCRGTGPNAQVIGTWLSYDTAGNPKGAFVDNLSYAPNGYLLDGTAWTKYRMQHVITSNSDGLTADPGGGVCGYVIPCIWWHSNTGAALAGGRYVMGAMLTSISGVGGSAIAPLAPDVYLTLGVPSKLIGPDPNKSKMGP